MAIGNAPWPIGVTMVGIHARTGREKIFSKNVAHVLNDETQRKYIQALKRLMTKCQQLFPTDRSSPVIDAVCSSRYVLISARVSYLKKCFLSICVSLLEFFFLSF